MPTLRQWQQPDDLSIKIIFISIVTGGVVVEHDENDRLIAKPYNVNEVNK